MICVNLWKPIINNSILNLYYRMATSGFVRNVVQASLASNAPEVNIVSLIWFITFWVSELRFNWSLSPFPLGEETRVSGTDSLLISLFQG